VNEITPFRHRAGYVALLGFGLVATAWAQPACPEAGVVVGETKISLTEGGFGGGLESQDRFGLGIAALGDLDGDGVPDLAVGAGGDDAGGSAAGAVWILFMNADGTVRAEQEISNTQGGLVGSPLQPAAIFGISVAGLGDLDGDGVPDLAVGAVGDDEAAPSAGAMWVLLLDNDGTVKSQQKITTGVGGFGGTLTMNNSFGYAIASLGDLDGDGVVDLAVGARGDLDGGSGRGAVWILFLNNDGTVKAEQKISDTQGGFGGLLDDRDAFGSGVAGLGDLDGDGVPDLAVGATGDADGGSFRGAMYVCLLRTDGTVKAEHKTSDLMGFLDLQDLDQFGSSIGTIGDLDGDGVVDLAVSVPQFGSPLRGELRIVFLNADGSAKGVRTISESEGGFAGPLYDGDVFGYTPEVWTDADGDGRPELAVGSYVDDDGAVDAGAIYILELDICNVPPQATLTSDSVLLDFNGGMAVFEAAAVGTEPLDYQWRRDGIDLADGGGITGATTPTLTINAGPADEGLYDVVVTNAFGSDITDAVILAIRANPCPGDFDGDGVLTLFDFLAFQNAFDAGCE